MVVKDTNIRGVYIIEPKIFNDDRGYFFESFNEGEFNKLTGANFHPIQDNESMSARGVVRGLHFQKAPYAQAKLVRVVKGEVFDFAVDLRKDSPTYGQWTEAYLSEDNHKQFFIPRGFAHGFIALADNTVFQYKCDNYYNKESEGAINIIDDSITMATQKGSSTLGLGAHITKISKDWCGSTMIFSDKDTANKNLVDIELDAQYIDILKF